MATPTHLGRVQLELLALNLLCGCGDDAVGVEVGQEQGVDQGRLSQSCGKNRIHKVTIQVVSIGS